MDPFEPTVFHHLELEWEHLRTGRRLERALDRWCTADERLARFGCLADLLAVLEGDTVGPEVQSEVLLALLGLVKGGDELAGRLVLQRFIPPLKAIAGWRQPLDQVDWAAMVVSAGYEVIATYPIERRPHRVAGNIVWDVRKRMYATLREHRRCMAELSTREAEPDAAVEPDVADRHEAADLLRWAADHCQIPREVAWLILLTRAAGFQVEELAERRAVPSARLRQRRWRCEQRMREAMASC